MMDPISSAVACGALLFGMGTGMLHESAGRAAPRPRTGLRLPPGPIVPALLTLANRVERRELHAFRRTQHEPR